MDRDLIPVEHPSENILLCILTPNWNIVLNKDNRTQSKNFESSKDNIINHFHDRTSCWSIFSETKLSIREEINLWKVVNVLFMN